MSFFLGGQKGYQNVLFYVLIRRRREGVNVNKDNVIICSLFILRLPLVYSLPNKTLVWTISINHLTTHITYDSLANADKKHQNVLFSFYNCFIFDGDQNLISCLTMSLLKMHLKIKINGGNNRKYFYCPELLCFVHYNYNVTI